MPTGRKPYFSYRRRAATFDRRTSSVASRARRAIATSRRPTSSRSPIDRRRQAGSTANVVTWASSTISQIPAKATTTPSIFATRYVASLFVVSSLR
jgi:hypothetical protein